MDPYEADDEGRGPEDDPRSGRVRAPGIGGLSRPYRVVAALALGVVAVVAGTHLAMVFLHVAPSNTVTKQHGDVVGDWIYPEFEQNWKLFAPNPLQQNIAVEARAEVKAPDGERTLTGWEGLSAEDGAAIDGNLLPSHTQQNELRRAWDFYASTHDSDDNRPSGGLRSELSDRYVHRIALMRLAERAPEGAKVTQVQLRVRTTNVQPPDWSTEKIEAKPSLRQLPWWPVTARDADLGAGRAPAGAGARSEDAR
ncbi:DUF5819 family protein [Streptomyces sp. NPDC060194]|uniref:DUF5819 family protein n=1 Tax=Streptomyces sp. NPDC060194 TaxID=3347069 RepID=UPI003657354A